jgi:hypothetical protein
MECVRVAGARAVVGGIGGDLRAIDLTNPPPNPSPLSLQVTSVMLALLDVDRLARRIDAMVFATSFLELSRDLAVRVAGVELTIEAILTSHSLRNAFFGVREVINAISHRQAGVIPMGDLARIIFTKTKTGSLYRSWTLLSR